MAKTKTKKKSRKGVLVTLAKMSSDDLHEIRVPSGSTVRKVLAKAGFSASEMSGAEEGLRVNGKEANLGDRVTKGAFITITPRVEGGC